MSVYMKLLVVVSLTLTISHVGVHSARVRRSEPRTLTEKLKSDIINKHNELRAREGASNMEYMMWKESLAAAAADKVAQCVWRHGSRPLPGAIYESNFTAYGQNLFTKINGRINVVGSIHKWYDQKPDFDYEKLACTAGKVCKFYTQLVWATSRQVGCAHHYCKTVVNTRFRDVEFLACNYLPAGNFEGLKPFKKGPACSQCEGGAGWCKDKLCNSRCTKAGKDCSCEAICHNCATLNLTTCRCSCLAGWTGPDCSEPCEDTNEYCNPNLGSVGWPPSWCNHHEHGYMIRRECPLMCKQCEPDPDAEAGKCPPAFAARAAKPVAMVVKPAAISNGSHHQQQCITFTLLSNVILSLTITWKALL